MKLKKDYAKKAKDNADNAKSASEKASKTASKIRNEVKKIAEYIKTHKEILGVIAVIALLAVLMLGVASSCSVFVQSGVSGLGVSTYPSKDEDMLSAESHYSALEEALNQEIQDYELTHSYDEYI
ncbi:MAG TPA: peptidase M23, partial [Ruminococcaceae bacterium]|nr:peptidase M23 [Oscillospiraceae bacterium]